MLALKVPCNKLNILFFKKSYKSISYSQNAKGSFDFSERTENCEKRTFEALKAILPKLPPVDGNH